MGCPGRAWSGLAQCQLIKEREREARAKCVRLDRHKPNPEHDPVVAIVPSVHSILYPAPEPVPDPESTLAQAQAQVQSRRA